jgi:hypothetical protein
MPEANYKIEFTRGEKIALRVCEPIDPTDASANVPSNYAPRTYVGEVEEVGTAQQLLWIKVRWHLPAYFGYNTQKGKVSKLIHIANGVWIEARKRARNVVATIESVDDSTYQKMLKLADTGASGAPR